MESAGHQAPGDLATEDWSKTGEGKIHLQSNTDRENYIRKFDGPAKNFTPQSEEEHEFYNQVLGSIGATFGKYPNVPDFPLNFAIWSQ